jgi:carbonic anhydrase/acetyltransferase-like protein (isoleucine patch superfamily)
MQIHDTAFIAPGAVVLGDVTIGHGAIVHGCKIGDNTMIGMGAILMNGCKIGKNCIIGAGALVTQNVEIPVSLLPFPFLIWSKYHLLFFPLVSF